RSRPKGPLKVLMRAISILAFAVLAARLVAVAWVLTLTALIVQFSMPVVGIWMSGPLPPVALVVKGTLVDTKVLVMTAHDGVGVGVGPGVGVPLGMGDGVAGGVPPPGIGGGEVLGPG